MGGLLLINYIIYVNVYAHDKEVNMVHTRKVINLEEFIDICRSENIYTDIAVEMYRLLEIDNIKRLLLIDTKKNRHWIKEQAKKAAIELNQ